MKSFERFIRFCVQLTGKEKPLLYAPVMGHAPRGPAGPGKSYPKSQALLLAAVCSHPLPAAANFFGPAASPQFCLQLILTQTIMT